MATQHQELTETHHDVALEVNIAPLHDVLRSRIGAHDQRENGQVLKGT